MSKFDEILNSSNPSDTLLGEQIDRIAARTDSETFSVNLSSVSLKPTSSVIVSETANKVIFKKVGDLVYVDIRLKITNSDTNNVMTTITFNNMDSRFVPSIARVFPIRVSTYVSDNDCNANLLFVQVNTDGSITLFLADNKKFSTISGRAITGQGFYMV